MALALACVTLSLTPEVFGVTPAPDGGYPNGNTAEGTNALKSLTTGTDNTAIGFDALFSNTDSQFNTATGSSALYSNTTGNNNTANGFGALNNNTTGCCNTAIGYEALLSNTTGGANTATGLDALFFNTTGLNNTATGALALNGCAVGAFCSSTGNNNTATGASALASNNAGNNNTAEGFQALLNTTGSNNIGLGANAGINLTTGNNNIIIGASGTAGESNTIRIGKGNVHKAAYMGGISGATVAGGVGVVVDARGHLGTVQSSARFKDEIKPMDKASEAILALKPVTFRYKKELDPDGIPQFGLVAEQVEKVNPDLVARDEKRQVYTVRYEAVNAMLLNEFLKEHRKVEEQQAMIDRQQKQIEALSAGLEKLSERIEVSAP